MALGAADGEVAAEADRPAAADAGALLGVGWAVAMAEVGVGEHPPARNKIIASRANVCMESPSSDHNVRSDADRAAAAPVGLLG